ncbi:DUF362 domain-containing protein [Candidatus Bathyarchaeota archaeon]|nr:DUF362 domain-containing protein [Candidatus Bathyarchaeota archaeon]
MRKAVVAIVKGKDPVRMTIKALEMINAEKTVSPDDTVLIKPNYVTAKHPLTGVTTDPHVIEGLVKFLRQYGVRSITIAEGSGFCDTFEAYELAGVAKIAKAYGIRLVDLNKDQLIEIRIPNAMVLKKVKLAKTALESSCIISVPKLKTHSLTKVTLSLKNLMGAVIPKDTMHNNLEEKIVDLFSLIRPKLAVIDGLIGCSGGELGGTPVRMDIIIAGADPIAVDAIGAAIMGIKPSEVDHIRLAEGRGLGVGSLDGIDILQEGIGWITREIGTNEVVQRLREDWAQGLQSNF